MLSCNMANRLYAAVPWARFRGFLIRTHMDGCERCQAGLVSRGQARTLLVGPGEAGSPEALWGKVRAGAVWSEEAAGISPGASRFRWEWAAGAVTTILASLMSLWLVRGLRPGEGGPEIVRSSDRFEIHFIHVGGAQAQAFIYQPQGSDAVFVWAAKSTP